MNNIFNETLVNALLNAAELIGKSLHPQTFMDAMLKLLSEKLQLKKARVLLPDGESGLLKIRYAFDLSDEEKARGVYHIGEGVTGQVIRTGKIALIPDVATEPAYLARVSQLSALQKQTIAYIAVPIFQDNNAIGVLAVHAADHDRVQLESALYVLQILAAIIGQQLKLYELVQKQTSRLQQENAKLKKRTEENNYFGLLGHSPAFKAAVKAAQKAALSSAPVLLTGESGTGKEKFARMIHLAGDRQDGPFICVNCAAIPRELLESELFGHEKGSFTGATAEKIGKLQMAGGGTLFLDEIGEMPLSLQVKLLRVLQDKILQRVGGTDEIEVDFRIIAATNRDLESSVKEQTFRMDLFYRLNVIRIPLPPLKERKKDIRLLTNYFLNRANQRYGTNIMITDNAVTLLRQYEWPGNIRQLENVIERLVIMHEQEWITEQGIKTVLKNESGLNSIHESSPYHNNGEATRKNNDMMPWGRPYLRLEPAQRDAVLNALQQAGGNKTQAARLLGMSTRQLYYRLRKFELMDAV